MGGTSNMIRILFAVAALIVLASALDEEINKNFSEASQAVEVMLQQGKGDSACRKLATESGKEISDGARNTQSLLNRMDVGKNCHTAGLAAYNAAKRREADAKKSANTATHNCNKAKNVRVRVGSKSLSQFKVGCNAFLSDRAFTSAKAKMTKTCNDATRKRAAHADSRRATAIALKAHQKAKDACACRAQKNHKAAVRTTSNFNSAANAKAWTKAHHMICVLDGKAANRCSVPPVPRVTAPRMPSWVARFNNCESHRRERAAKKQKERKNKNERKNKAAEKERKNKNERKNKAAERNNKAAERKNKAAERKNKAAERKQKYTLQCKYQTTSSNRAGVVKTPDSRGVGAGYQLVGGGINNHYRSWNKLSAFEQAIPHGNHFQCDTGYGPGRLTCYAAYCKKAGMSCHTKKSAEKHVVFSSHSVFAPNGYTMTGGGLINHYRGWNKPALFQRSHPNGNSWVGDMGQGWGHYSVYVRYCVGVSCKTISSGVGNYKVVNCPSGYKVTSCGSHQMNGWGHLGAFEQYQFNGNGCSCDMGFGHGKQRCYARCCK